MWTTTLSFMLSHNSISNMCRLSESYLLPRDMLSFSFFLLLFLGPRQVLVWRLLCRDDNAYYIQDHAMKLFISLNEILYQDFQTENNKQIKALRFTAFIINPGHDLVLWQPKCGPLVKCCLQSYLPIFVSTSSCCCFGLHIVYYHLSCPQARRAKPLEVQQRISV